MINLEIKSIDDINQFPGNFYSEKLSSFYNEFKKVYGNKPTKVRPIVYTAFIILGKDTSQLIVDPYIE